MEEGIIKNLVPIPVIISSCMIWIMSSILQRIFMHSKRWTEHRVDWMDVI